MQQALVQTVQYQAPRHKYEDRRLEITWFDFGIRIYIPFFFPAQLYNNPIVALCSSKFVRANKFWRRNHYREEMTYTESHEQHGSNARPRKSQRPAWVCTLPDGMWVTETGMWVAKQKETTHSCPVNMCPLLLWRILSAERELQWPIDNVPICERSSSWSWWSLQPWRPKVVGNPIQSTSPNVRALRVVEDGCWKIGAEWPGQHTNCKALRQRRLF